MRSCNYTYMVHRPDLCISINSFSTVCGNLTMSLKHQGPTLFPSDAPASVFYRPLPVTRLSGHKSQIFVFTKLIAMYNFQNILILECLPSEKLEDKTARSDCDSHLLKHPNISIELVSMKLFLSLYYTLVEK